MPVMQPRFDRAIIAHPVLDAEEVVLSEFVEFVWLSALKHVQSVLRDLRAVSAVKNDNDISV